MVWRVIKLSRFHLQSTLGLPAGPRWLGLVSYFRFFMGIKSSLTFLALQLTQWPEDAVDGQVWAISGSHVVGGGWEWSKILSFSLGINFYLTLMAIESTQGPEEKVAKKAKFGPFPAP